MRIAFCILTGLLCNFIAFGQEPVIALHGDTITINTTPHTGNVKWQISTDSLNWSDIEGATFDSYEFEVNGNISIVLYYRALLEKNFCWFPSTVQRLNIIYYEPGGGTVDIMGNPYNSVIIGDQEWLSENLKTLQYNNGDGIINNLSNSEWIYTDVGSYAIYENNPYYYDLTGTLYNWYAVTDPRGICPIGWRVPSNEDWLELTDYLGGLDIAGGKLKATDSILWDQPNIGASNASGFLGQPGGTRRGKDGQHLHIRLVHWWTVSELSVQKGWIMGLVREDEFVAHHTHLKRYGYNVRCIKEEE